MAVDTTRVPVRRGVGGLLHDAFGNEDCKLYRAVQRALALVVLYATGLMVFASVSSIYSRYHAFFRISEACVVGVFLLEYLCRAYVASPRRRYMFGAWGIIDVLSVAISPNFSGPFDLRVFYPLRVLKLGRVIQDDWVKIRASGPGSLRTGLRAYTTAMFMVLIVGSVLVFTAEAPDHLTTFTNIPEAMWWGVGAMTPLDSGMTPLTIVGRVFAAMTSVCGLALFAFLIHIIGRALVPARSDA